MATTQAIVNATAKPVEMADDIARVLSAKETKNMDKIKCPYCKSNNIDTQTIVFKYRKGGTNYVCLSCGHRW